jgi:hypothetical protein
MRVQLRCHQGKHFAFLHISLSLKTIEVNLTQFRKKSRTETTVWTAAHLLARMAKLSARSQKELTHVEEGKDEPGDRFRT